MAATAATMRSTCWRTRDHLVLPVRTTTAMRRARRFCWKRIRRSVVISSSKPACSAASNSSPLLSVSQPSDCAVWTLCPDRAPASPFGVPWSKRTSTGRNVRSAQTVGHELEDGSHLLARHIELFDDFVDAEILEVFDDRGHRQAGALEHPYATDFVGDALDGGALGPVKCCHGRNSSPQITGN